MFRYREFFVYFTIIGAIFLVLGGIHHNNAMVAYGAACALCGIGSLIATRGKALVSVPACEVAIIKVFRDGDRWCALSGENIQEGIMGSGISPAIALTDLAYEVQNEAAERQANALRGAPVEEWFDPLNPELSTLNCNQ